MNERFTRAHVFFAYEVLGFSELHEGEGSPKILLLI
jgi:hypothetical protein